MVFIKSLILFTSVLLTLPSHSQDSGMVERINERYDDFFRFLRAQEERAERQNHGADERKKREREHERAMEKAREQYVRVRKARPTDEALRLRYEAAQKERAVQLEMMRRRYVQQRELAEQYMKKGRQIPGLKEFDLEDD